jgi:hypothetical protein
METKKYYFGNAILNFEELKIQLMLLSFDYSKKQIETILKNQNINISILNKL